MDLAAPPHPVTTRLAAAVLAALSVLVLPATAAGFARGLAAGIDPTARWPLAAGALLGLAELALGFGVAGISALAALLLVAQPTWGRLIAVLAAAAWLPLGCGVVSLAILGLAWFPVAVSPSATPGRAPPRPRTPPSPPAAAPPTSRASLPSEPR